MTQRCIVAALLFLTPALAVARARADAAASGSGHAVARVVRIEEQGVVLRPPVPFMAAREALQPDAPPIAAGLIELRAQVTLTAELK